MVARKYVEAQSSIVVADRFRVAHLRHVAVEAAPEPPPTALELVVGVDGQPDRPHLVPPLDLEGHENGILSGAVLSALSYHP